MADQELGMHIENEVTSGDDLQKLYTVDEFEVRIMELEKQSGCWATRFTIPMQPFENTLTVRIVTLQVCISSSSYWFHIKQKYFTYYNVYLFSPQNTNTKENESLMAIGTAYIQGEDVAARGRVLLFSFTRSENSQNLVTGRSSIVLIWKAFLH